MGRRALTTTFGIRSRSLAGVAGTVALALLGVGSLLAASGSASAAAVTSCAGVAVGAHGPAVATVQRAVGATPDGDFGPMTRAAVAHWQKVHAVTATGVVDAKTWRALPREVALAACAQPVRGSGAAPTCTTLAVNAVGTAVAVLQRRVHVGADGEFGPQTLAALRATQRQLKLPATGVADASTWAALGLTGTPVCVNPSAGKQHTPGGTPAPPTTSPAPKPAPTPSPKPTATAPAPKPGPPSDAAQQAKVRAQVVALAAKLPSLPGTSTDPVALKALAFARSQTGKPYVWGGAGPGGYDCSGLVMTAYRHAGVTTPRVAADQYGTGVSVPLDQARQGDLLFFGSDVLRPATIYHVVLYAGAGQVLDAPHTGAFVGTRRLWTGDLFPVAWRPTGLLTLPVKQGATGWTVAQLQQALVRGGQRLSVDGAFGPATAAGVRSWQAAHKLPATGVADLATWLTLG